jgi:DNA-binding PadR family transcriptional regulator
VSERRIANPLALAVLACLAERPMHPYDVAATLRERHQDEAIKLNYGSLYSVFEALCRHDFIVAREKIKDGNRPERTVFALTDAGKHELHDWLSELLAEPKKEYTHFEAGLSLLPALPPAQALALLRRRAETLERELADARARDDAIRAKGLARLLWIEREFATELRTTELKWLRHLIADLAAGRLEGLDEWRRWHRAKAVQPA